MAAERNILMTTTVSSIEKDLRTQIGVIGEAVSRVKAGIIMNIDEVEKQVAQICEKISTLPEGDARSLEQSMAEMIEKLEELAEVLSKFQNESGNGTN